MLMVARKRKEIFLTRKERKQKTKGNDNQYDNDLTSWVPTSKQKQSKIKAAMFSRLYTKTPKKPR